jgi:hypothetical protein
MTDIDITRHRERCDDADCIVCLDWREEAGARPHGG